MLEMDSLLFAFSCVVLNGPTCLKHVELQSCACVLSLRVCIFHDTHDQYNHMTSPSLFFASILITLYIFRKII